MTLKKVYSSILPFKGYLAMTCYPWMFIRKEYKGKLSPIVYMHEMIHAKQQVETLWIPFLLLYVLEYLVKYIACGFNHKKAYRSISFEQEAYANENNKKYKTIRKHYAWVKYIFKLK